MLGVQCSTFDANGIHHFHALNPTGVILPADEQNLRTPDIPPDSCYENTKKIGGFI
jgi:hypothetical protein